MLTSGNYGSYVASTPYSTAANFFYQNVLPSETDLDTIVSPRFYVQGNTGSCASMINGPSGRSNGELWFMTLPVGAGNGYGQQLYYSQGGPSWQLWARSFYSGVFTSWVQFIHTGNYSSYCATAGHNHDSSYAPKVTHYLGEVGDYATSVGNILDYFNDNSNIHHYGNSLNSQLTLIRTGEGNSGNSNLASGDAHYMVFSIDNSNSWIHPIAIDVRSSRIYSRAKTNGSWDSSWKTVAFTDDNVASSTYATSAGNSDTVDGCHASEFATAGHTHNYAGSSSAGGSASNAIRLSTRDEDKSDEAWDSSPGLYVYRMTPGSEYTTASGADGFINFWSWGGSTYGCQLYVDVDPTGHISLRQRDAGGNWTQWWEILHTGNYTSYCATANHTHSEYALSTHEHTTLSNSEIDNIIT